jgi:hypothetical protein
VIETYIKDNKEYQVQAVQDNQDPEQPPGCLGWKQQRETSARVIEEKLKLFPYATLFRYVLACDPDDDSKHDWKPSISDDDQKAHQ